ncbi:tetratricopeptide repeat protein [Undibacterium sp. Dicai25W]|uniref:tetratricopeptide repeat protein n=1 Tax=Undibacterium sp. Dicai25W TaxID=3413034 RepID=UPI003BF350B1
MQNWLSGSLNLLQMKLAAEKQCVQGSNVSETNRRSATFIQLLLAIAFSGVLSGCNSVKISPSSNELFQDSMFRAPTAKINPDEVFALSDEMSTYLRKEQVKSNILRNGLKQGLFKMISNNKSMRIEYDAEMTRNAAQTFSSRSGNCLSLVILTAAFAKKLELQVQFQKVVQDNNWSQSDNLMFAVGHVNVNLSKKATSNIGSYDGSQALIVDFMPSENLQNQKIIPIDEKTILAMYMNNRAAEQLSQNQIDEAYWYAKEAIKQDPSYLSAYNTLGVVYRRHNNLHQAEQAFREILKYDTNNLIALANLAELLQKSGRLEESLVVTNTLHQLQPVAPFYYFDLGKKALQNDHPVEAINLIKKELDRDPYYHEFHLWLALSYIRLGNLSEAKKELVLAKENSITHSSFDFYTSKMERLNASLSNSH